MKILHIESTCGIPWILAEEQNRLGHYSRVLETWHNPQERQHDFENYYTGNLYQKFRKMIITARMARPYDIIHIHSGIRRSRLDYLFIHYFDKKPIVAHYHGSETRVGYGLHYQRLPDAKIVVTPDLLKWLPDAHFIPNPFPASQIVFDKNTRPTVLHMPSDRTMKGTPLIMEAMQELKQEGLDFNFVFAEGKSHKEALELIRQSHVVIDQVTDLQTANIPGLYGVVSQEAWSMGKASVAHMDEGMLKYYPGCPIVNVSVDIHDLKEKVRRLVENPSLTEGIGRAGHEYVKEFHDPLKIAHRTIDIYQDVLSRKR